MPAHRTEIMNPWRQQQGHSAQEKAHDCALHKGTGWVPGSYQNADDAAIWCLCVDHFQRPDVGLPRQQLPVVVPLHLPPLVNRHAAPVCVVHVQVPRHPHHPHRQACALVLQRLQATSCCYSVPLAPTLFQHLRVHLMSPQACSLSGSCRRLEHKGDSAHFVLAPGGDIS